MYKNTKCDVNVPSQISYSQKVRDLYAQTCFVTFGPC